MNTIVPLVSFPKSGNTWMRFILANIFKRDKNIEINFKNINEYMPTSYNDNFMMHNELFIDNSPIFVKEHYNYHNMGYKDFKKAIYIYRDGFDTLYSYWHFANAQSPGLYKNLDTFSKCYWNYCGHWGEHIISWLGKDTQKKHDILAISYEEMLNQPFEIMKKVIEFLDIDIDDKIIQEAIALSDKNNMKKLSGSDTFMKSQNKDFHFVRSAKKGESKEKLSQEIKNNFLSNNNNYEMMIKYNYLIDKENFSIENIYNKSNCVYCKVKIFVYRIMNKFFK